MANYQETRIDFAPGDVPDLYAIHRRVMVVTDGDKSITYAPRGINRDGRMEVVLRAMPGVDLPDGIMAEIRSVKNGDTFLVYAGVRLMKRSDSGERMPTLDVAREKWTAALTAGGFQVSDSRLAASVMAFYHKRLNQKTRLPFWVASSRLKVVDAEKAAETLIRGVGRSRGLGFGMLMVAGLEGSRNPL